MNNFASLAKYAVYIANVVFVLIGILIIVLGAVMLGNLGGFSLIDGVVDVKLLPILIIVLGCIVFFISFLGCWGTIRECSFLHNSVCIFVLVCLKVSLVAWAFVKRLDVLKTMEDYVAAVWFQNIPPKNFPMDVLEINFQCCGKTSYKDYTDNNAFVRTSCCGSLDSTETCPESVYKTKPGCVKEFVHFWSTNMDIIRYAGLVVAAVEFGIFIVVGCLSSNMSKSHHLRH